MKGNLIRFAKKTVTVCIMIAALTVSASSEVYVNAEGVVAGEEPGQEEELNQSSGENTSGIPENSSNSNDQLNNDIGDGDESQDNTDGQDAHEEEQPANDDQQDIQPAGENQQQEAAENHEQQPGEATQPEVQPEEDASRGDLYAELPSQEAPSENVPSQEEQPEDATSQDNPSSDTSAQDGQSAQTPSQEEQSAEIPQQGEEPGISTPQDAQPSDTSAQQEQPAAGASQGTQSAEKNDAAELPTALSVTGTPTNPVEYDGNAHEVSIRLNTASTSNGELAVATDANGKTYYIGGLADNTVTVTATEVTNGSNNKFQVSISQLPIYDGTYNQVADLSASLLVTADNVITKRSVTLKSMNVVKPYDGTPLTNGGMPLSEESGWLPGDGANYEFTASITSVGVVQNVFTISSYKDGTNPDVYDIHYTYGALQVVDRTDEQKYILTIEGTNGTVKYSGKEQSISGFTLEGRSSSEYQVSGNGDPTQVLNLTIGNATFSVTGIAASGAGTNAGEYPVNITGTPVIKDSEGNDVTGQFSYEFKPGKLTIEKRKVILTSASLTKKFDDKTHKKHEVTVSGDGFVEGEGATYEFTGKQKKIGESYNYFTYNLNPGTLAENYDIEVVPGVLKIKKPDDKAINETPQENNSSDSGDSSSGQAPADTTAQAPAADNATVEANPNVLGAKRESGDVTVDIANPTDDNVLGARRSSTDDYSDLGRHIIVFAAAILFMTILTLRRDKRKKND